MKSDKFKDKSIMVWLNIEPEQTRMLYRQSSSFIAHLECSMTGEIYEKGMPHGLSGAGKPLLVRYDLEKIAQAVTREDMERRPGRIL